MSGGQYNKTEFLQIFERMIDLLPVEGNNNRSEFLSVLSEVSELVLSPNIENGRVSKQCAKPVLDYIKSKIWDFRETRLSDSRIYDSSEISPLRNKIASDIFAIYLNTWTGKKISDSTWRENVRELQKPESARYNAIANDILERGLRIRRQF